MPSGASTGAAEAHELRDGDPLRYGGLGCLRAVDQINGTIRRWLSGGSFEDQSSFDGALIDLDGTPNKSRLGANAILAVSLAFARAHAIEQGIPLYRHFAAMADRPIEQLPRMTINLFSGGKHAGQQCPIQDVLIVPASAATIGDGLVMSSAVYQAAVRLVQKNTTCDGSRRMKGACAAHGKARANVRRCRTIDPRCGLRNLTGTSAWQWTWRRATFGETAVTTWDKNGWTGQMVDRLLRWVELNPIVSVEDGLAEEDWDHWPSLCEAAPAGRALVLGDDLLCTNPQRIARAVDCRACNRSC